MTALLDLN